MKWHHLLSFGLSMLLVLSEISSSATACSGMSQLDHKYSYLLDLVFPTEWELCSPPGFHALFATEKMIIRILPGLSQESQILVCRTEESKSFVAHSTLSEKSHSVWSHLYITKKLSENAEEAVPSEEPVESIAKQIQVDNKACKIDSRHVDTWFAELRNVRMELPKANGGNDGVIYDVTIEHGMDSMHASIWVADQQRPLIALVDKISREVSSANCETLGISAKHS